MANPGDGKESFDEYQADDEQKTNYGKTGAHTMNTRDDKTESTGKGEMLRAGGDSGENNGPTGSKRNYAKKGREMGTPHNTDWNPMKSKPSTYGICGEC
jgi:hypothetical protein